MPIFAVNQMPGLTASVFALPLLVIGLLAALLVHFFARFPQAAPFTEPDTAPDDADTKPGMRLFIGAHYDRVVPAVIATLFYLIALYRLDYPPKQVFDEVHHVRTAMEFVRGDDPHEWTHPHVSKLLQAASLARAGETFDPSDNVWSPDARFRERAALAWRLPSVIFGTLALLGVYTLARALFKNRMVATLAMIFLACDGVFFVQSRIAMTNIFTVCFIIWAAWAAWRWTEENRARHVFAMGLFLGLAIGSRWSSLYPYVLLVIFVLADGIARWARAKFAPRFFAGRAVLFISALLLVPAIVYAASYIPFVLQGDGDLAQKLLNTKNDAHGWGKVWSQQGDMYNYHSQLKADHSYDSPAWSWPLMLRPVWYYFEQTGEGVAKRTLGIWCIGNAFIWWAILPTMAVGWWLAARRKAGNLGLLVLLGLGQWFCWLAKARGLNFMHYLFEVVPFVCIALAYYLTALWQNGDGEAGEKNSHKNADTPNANVAQYHAVVAFYIGLIVLWFVFYYPLLAAYPITDWYYDKHFWLKTIWI